MDPAARKKPPPDFVIRMVGPGVRPWAVPMRALAGVLQAVQRLVEQWDGEDAALRAIERVTTLEQEQQSLRLIDVRSSSAAYSLTAPHPETALKLIRKTGDDLKMPREADWTEATLSSLSDLSVAARTLGCHIEFRLPGGKKGYGDVLAVIGPDTFSEVEKFAYIKGPSSILARIERVGGATEMRCGVRLHEQARMVICTVTSEELVRELGRYIYQDVVLYGEATWLRRSFSLKNLVVTAVESPKTGSILSALKKIQSAGGEGWDVVSDPEAEIAGMRDE